MTFPMGVFEIPPDSIKCLAPWWLACQQCQSPWCFAIINRLPSLLPNHNTPIAVDTWFNSVRRAGQDFTRYSQNVSLLLFSLVAPIIHCILPNKHSLLVFQIVSWNVKFQYILFGFILVPIFLIIMLLIFLLCHRVILGHAIFDPPFLEISHTF